MRSQVACGTDTGIAPGTTRWNSMKVMRPAQRVTANHEPQSRRRRYRNRPADAVSASSSTASSIKPPIEERIRRQPCHR